MSWALVALVTAQTNDVIVYMNDTRLSYTGRGSSGDDWGDSDYYKPDCGGYRYMQYLDNSVTLSFTGTAVTVVFLADSTHGATANVLLDGAVSRVVNTMISGKTTGCVPLNSTLVNLADTTHNVTLVLTAQSTNPGYVDIQHFVYTPSESVPPTTVASVSAPASSTVITATSSGSSHTKSNAPIIGGVVGGIAILMIGGVLACLLTRRRRQNQVVPEQQAIPWLHSEPYPPEPVEYKGKAPAVTPTYSYTASSSPPETPGLASQPVYKTPALLSRQGWTTANEPPAPNADLDRHPLQNLISHDVPARAIARVIEIMGGEGGGTSRLAEGSYEMGARAPRPPPRYEPPKDGRTA
ncbi:hypothetical protein FRB94_004369 [Tulasnella sp. JGI-2019a]|nr:hypothetical protein FRB93_004784 [Tulasnella sp. JGI-2019a]KAG9012976.1 hypothetical protein FRB94_004369 [Tulasnella sp. JGI-2019a]